MNSPRTLVLSIAATGCGFLLALVGVIGAASNAAAPAGAVAMAPSAVAMAPSIVSAVDQDAGRFDPVTYAVAEDR